jgi:hypothetical protein
MEIDKPSRRPMNHSTSEAKGRAETDLLFADELEIQCVAKRSAVVPSKVARALAVEQFQQIELIPILPIDEENARQFPVETSLLTTAPLRVVPAKQRTTASVAEELNRSTRRIARPQRRWLVRVGALSVIAGFAIGWVAGRPLSYSVSQVRANVVLPAPVGESPLGTSGLQRDTEKPAPPPAPRAADSVATVPTVPASAANSIARKEADVVKPPAVLTPSPLASRPEAAPAPARVDTAATAPAPVPLKEMPVAPAPREPAVEKPIAPPTNPAGEAPVATSPATRPPVPERTASPIEAVNETAAVRAALTKYANAYTDLDAAAVTAVWPSVDQAGLRRAFSALDAQQVTFDRCDVQVTGGAGRATCAGTTMWRPKIGGGSAREQNRTWNFVLKNAGGSWQIVKAEVR